LQLFDQFLTGVPSIMEDGRAAGAVATRHLLDLGHQHVLHLTMADYDDRLQAGRRRNTKARYEGYRDTMLEAGLEPIICDAISNRIAPPMYGEARNLAGWIMEHPARPTAVFCYSDRIAFGLLNGLADLGVRVPQDMSVVGFDNLPAGVWSRPALTSVGVDRVEMGKQAARALFSAMQGETARAVQLKPRIVQRQSTGAPRVKG
jgi:LacI family transcriptional regulator